MLAIAALTGLAPIGCGGPEEVADFQTLDPSRRYRIVDRFQPTSAAEISSGNQTRSVVEWDFESGPDADAEGFPAWSPSQHIEGARIEDGALVFDVTGNDPWLVLDAPVNFLEYARLEVTMESDAGTLVGLLWTPAATKVFDASRVATQQRKPKPGAHPYTFDLLGGATSDLATRSLRFDPIDTPGRVRIESIRLIAPEPSKIASHFEVQRRGLADEYRDGTLFLGSYAGTFEVPRDAPPDSILRFHFGVPAGEWAFFEVHETEAPSRGGGRPSRGPTIARASAGREGWTTACMPVEELGGPGTLVGIEARCRTETGSGIVGDIELLAPQAAGGPGPNLLFLVVDTLRADRLGCYGGPAGISPRIDELAESCTRFEQAIPQSSWTLPSVASYLCSRYPPEIGVEWGRNYSIPPEVNPPTRDLAEAGYATGCVFANGILDIGWGFDRGFDSFTLGPALDLTAELVTDAGIAWLEDHGQQPFFLYLHYIDPHDGYEPPARDNPFVNPEEGVDERRIDDLFMGREELDGPEELALIRRLYDGEVFHADREIGRLLDWMESRGLLDETVVVFTADHGEELHDHGGWRHGLNLYHESARVPLLIRPPAGLSRSATVVTRPVELVDLFPTLLDFAGVSPTAELRGRSLRPLVAASTEAEADVEDRDASSNTSGAASRLAFSSTRTAGPPRGSAFDGRWKLMRFLKHVPWARRNDPLYTRMMQDYEAVELYDHETDPGEQRNLANDHPEIVRRLDEAMSAHADRIRENAIAPDSAAGMDDATKARLRALGYAVPGGESDGDD